MNNKTLVTLLGVVLLAIGLLGFINDPVLGLFDVNGTHNVIHLTSGALAFLLLARGEAGAILFGKIMAVVYGLVTVLGFIQVPDGGLLLGLVEVNTMDHILHLILTVIFAYIGFVNKPASVATAS